MQEIAEKMRIPRLTLYKKLQLKKEEANLLMDFSDLMETKSEWERLSLHNCNALSVPSSIEDSMKRNLSLQIPGTKTKVTKQKST